MPAPGREGIILGAARRVVIWASFKNTTVRSAQAETLRHSVNRSPAATGSAFERSHHGLLSVQVPARQRHGGRARGRAGRDQPQLRDAVHGAVDIRHHVAPSGRRGGVSQRDRRRPVRRHLQGLVPRQRGGRQEDEDDLAAVQALGTRERRDGAGGGGHPHGQSAPSEHSALHGRVSARRLLLHRQRVLHARLAVQRAARAQGVIHQKEGEPQVESADTTGARGGQGLAVSAQCRPAARPRTAQEHQHLGGRFVERQASGFRHAPRGGGRGL
ncbi:hypothetical protein ON010_g10454 [Phytophthora cinnamomi]|nr:hypothetical protein ON010_g10454 [Phytophthora cinnamomi]